MSEVVDGREPITIPLDRGMLDPSPELARLRERTPVCRLRFPDGHLEWLVTSYELARQVLGDGRFSVHPFRRPACVDLERQTATSVDHLRRDERLSGVIDRYVNGGNRRMRRSMIPRWWSFCGPAR